MSLSTTPCGPPTAEPRVLAVVLAAGQGRRMGGVPKALIQVNGQALLWRQLDMLRALGHVNGVVLVTGAHAAELTRSVAEWAATRWFAAGLQVVHNAAADSDQQGSVWLALQAIAPMPAWDVALLLPCDLPLLQADDLQHLLGEWAQRGDAEFLRPFCAGNPAHPVLLSPEGCKRVLADGPDVGCKKYMTAHPEAVKRCAAHNDHGAFDLDTPADLAALSQRTGWTVST